MTTTNTFELNILEINKELNSASEQAAEKFQKALSAISLDKRYQAWSILPTVQNEHKLYSECSTAVIKLNSIRSEDELDQYFAQLLYDMCSLSLPQSTSKTNELEYYAERSSLKFIIRVVARYIRKDNPLRELSYSF